MPFPRLQRLSLNFFAALAIRRARLRVWLREHPRVAAWVWGDRREKPEPTYADLNRWAFARFSEQERMLADRPRMDFYHSLVERHIHPGDRVIDLGTGTGILAAFASRRGAAKVYALDHSEILEDAKTLARHNGIENVEFIAGHSSKFTLEEPVDVILHEQMGDTLFDEEMIANVADLRKRLLKPGGRILPSEFELYCEPVKVRDGRAVPFLWEMKVKGYDYSPMDDWRPQEPEYYLWASDDPSLLDYYLGEPTPILTVDLHTAETAHLPLELNFTCKVVRAGRLDGFAVYFRALVDEDLTLSSNPLDPGRAPHWGYRVLRTEQTHCAVGDEIEVTLLAEYWPNSHTWRWRHEIHRVDRDPREDP